MVGVVDVDDAPSLWERMKSPLLHVDKKYYCVDKWKYGTRFFFV